jgi:uncharacterized tellurite resistance protein B-like protein
MGLFDAFKAKTPELTPRLSLAVGLLFMMSADGVIEQEEIGVLLANLHGDQRLLDEAISYGRATNIGDFLASSAMLLNDAQKLCVLLNLADALLSDGNAAAQEKNLFDRFLKSWNVSEIDFKSSLDIIMRKNDHSILGS